MLLVTTFGWLAASYFTEVINESAIPGKFEYISQVVQDWEEQPFVDMKVVTSDCEKGWDPVFVKEWGGLDELCLNYTRKGKNKSCSKKIERERSIEMTNLGGATICGKRGGKPFTEVARPTKEGSCPKNTVPCSEATSKENTVCVST